MSGMFGGPVSRVLLRIVLLPWWLKEKLARKSDCHDDEDDGKGKV